MRCAWQEYLRLLPFWMRKEVNDFGQDSLQELRLRTGQFPKMILNQKTRALEQAVVMDDLNYVINAASQYSPWAASTISNGYITAAGGHRIGICGDAVMQNGILTGIRSPTSLCIRVARDFPGIASALQTYDGSVLIIGPPGSGKTTLLRDLIRHRASVDKGSVGVIDERGEIFPAYGGTSCYLQGQNMDVLTGCGKKQGIDILLRTMSPNCIAVDEITQESDCKALLNAGWSGVLLLATAHAASRNDLVSRPVYRPLLANHLFDTLIILRADKSWKAERM